MASLCSQDQLYLVVREPWAPGLNPAHPTSLARPPASGICRMGGNQLFRQPKSCHLGWALPCCPQRAPVPRSLGLWVWLRIWLPGLGHPPSLLAYESSAGSQGCWLTRSGRGRVRTGLSREKALFSSLGYITLGTGKWRCVGRWAGLEL